MIRQPWQDSILTDQNCHLNERQYCINDYIVSIVDTDWRMFRTSSKLNAYREFLQPWISVVEAKAYREDHGRD